MPRKSGLPAGYRIDASIRRTGAYFIQNGNQPIEVGFATATASDELVYFDGTTGKALSASPLARICHGEGCAGSCPICRPLYVDKVSMTVCTLEPRGWWARVKAFVRRARCSVGLHSWEYVDGWFTCGVCSKRDHIPDWMW